MKRFLIIGAAVLFMMSTMQYASAISAEDSNTIKGAIAEYKAGNYLGCISNLKLYLEEDPTNVVAWYYLGNAYMKIAMKPEAHEAFDRVVQINSVPKLTSYSIQAKMCMENSVKCVYQNFTDEEIRELRANPSEFLTEYFAKMNSADDKSVDTVEIEKLINGMYGNNVHPEAQNFIIQQKTQSKQLDAGAKSKAELPADEKIAQAVMLMRQKQNSDIASLAMFLDNSDTSTDNNYGYNDFLQYYKNTDKELTPEMIKYSMMQTMLPNF